MGRKIGVIICSNSGADYETFDYPIEKIYTNLHLNDVIYKDYVDIAAEDFYNRIKTEPNLDIKTSQPPVGEIVQKYKELKKKGYQDILVITISNKLSGTYSGCVIASEMVEGVNVRVVDSKSVSYGELYLLLEAIKLIKAGHTLDEVADTVEAIIPKINVLVYVDTLKFLVKNGRLSATKGALATLLRIKPILRITQEDGALVPYEKIRTSKKAIKRIYEIFEKETKGKDIIGFVAYTDNKEFGEKVRKHLLTIRPDIKVELVQLTPVVGAHAGPGTLGVGYVII
ncbi:MAG: DegV family protein [Acholeplasmataceae bacterium]|jgi:DegV family protein with EDD domain